MNDFIFLITYVVKGAFKGIFKLGGLIVRPLTVASQRTLSRMRDSIERDAKTSSASMAAVGPQQAVQKEAPSRPLGLSVQSADFEVADRIVSIRLVPPVGVLNLRLYQDLKVVKRDLIVHEPRLRAIMKGRRFTFADATYDPKGDIEDIKDDTVELAEKLINELGNARVKAHKPSKDEKKAEVAEPSTLNKAADKAMSVAGPQESPAPKVAKHSPVQHQAAQVGAQPKMESKVFTPTPSVGITYVGRLMQAGSHRVSPRGRDPYEVFQATILLDNGAELPLRGAELERELEAAQCQVGERIAITPMGKVPVNLAGGREGSKNLYKVDNLTVTQ